MVVPYLLLNGVIICVALFKGLQVSFGYYPLIGLREVTFNYFKQVLTTAYFQKSLGYSCYLALTATFLSLVFGVGLAFLLLNTNSSFLHKVISLPISLPHIIVALLALQLFSQTGIISRFFYQIGWIKEIGQFPLLIHDVKGYGILFVFLYKEIPYVAITTLAILKQLQFGYIDVAKNLGASHVRILTTIILPLIQKTVCSLFVILFCFTFASFEVPFLLGSPSYETVAMTAYDLFTQADLATRPQAFALNLVMSGVCLLVSVLLFGISRLLPGGRSTQ
ncbi:hypothetical protein RV04_GL000976 [Enterococcus hermanniensis]|uniref:ABC transmembrane type-1 domain-containing protein n=1 Tax=Enterococcus hermanniensis TaxID=249189 RepID=A0A1L8TQT6_9ENTE|nr:hypothetical protein RV04_GL000976 [Enterococcus hermanniensis]